MEAVQQERGPRKPKTHQQILGLHHPHHYVRTTTQPSSSFTTSHQTYVYGKISSSLNTITNPIYEIAAQILLSAIKQVRCNSGFGALSRTSQNRILSQLWAPLFVLRATHWPSSSSSTDDNDTTLNVLMPNNNNYCQMSGRHIKALQMDETDLKLLENILLCRIDLLNDSRDIVVAKTVLDESLNALAVKHYSNRKQFMNIILSVPVLFLPSSGVLQSLLFGPVIGVIPIETVIATI